MQAVRHIPLVNQNMNAITSSMGEGKLFGKQTHKQYVLFTTWITHIFHCYDEKRKKEKSSSVVRHVMSKAPDKSVLINGIFTE